MAHLVEIDDPDDPRLADYRDLRDVTLRKRLETEHGLFLAEGAKVVRRAAAAGYPPRSFLMAPRWAEGLADVLDATDAPCFVVAESLAEATVGFHVHRGALASFERLTLPPLEEVLDGASRVVVLEDLVDHANVGSVFRNAAALGIDAVLVTPRCADPLYRRAVKTSMGNVFHVPWTRIPQLSLALPLLSAAGFTTVAMTLADDSTSLDDLAAPDGCRLAFVFGTEGTGVHPRTAESADLRVRIPMTPGVDSLNVAAATAVTFYATRPSYPALRPGSSGSRAAASGDRGEGEDKRYGTMGP